MSPSAYSQYSGMTCVKRLFAPLTMPAPRMEPIRVPRPPTATQIAISIELAGALYVPQSTAENVKMASL